MIKAIFPEGVSAMTVNGLHQWDYGKKLQIEASGLPALVEVHFACEGMQEAVVRVCAVTNGAAVAAIPDSCLEQTSPIFAWVYLVDESSGTTTLTVTLPVIARTRPQPGAEPIPEDVLDKYTEAIAAMNEAAASVAAGNIKVQNAYNADKATNATVADKALLASNATKATRADIASSIMTAYAGQATYQNGEGSVLSSLEDNTMYLVEVLYYSELSGDVWNYSGSGVFCHRSSNHIHYVTVGSLYLGLRNGARVSMMNTSDDLEIDTNRNYTINFYKMGAAPTA